MRFKRTLTKIINIEKKIHLKTYCFTEASSPLFYLYEFFESWNTYTIIIITNTSRSFYSKTTMDREIIENNKGLNR